MFNFSSVRLACLVALFALTVMCVGGFALAQSAVTGAVSGTVTDQNNAAVPGATVTLINSGTNREETTITTSEGNFRFTNLQPGAYTVSIKVSGFSDYKQEGLIVEVGRTTNVDAALRV